MPPEPGSDEGAPDLATLVAQYPLGGRWTRPTELTTFTDVLDLRIQIAGLTTSADEGTTVVGSAGHVDSSCPPLRRAYFELLERACLLDAMQAPRHDYAILDALGEARGSCLAREVFPEPPQEATWVYSRSNGVAIGRTFADACRTAWAELIERDRLLRAWFGIDAARPCLLPTDMLPQGLPAAYDFRVYDFPDAVSDGEALAVIGVFGFPRTACAPLVFGTGAADSILAALNRALRECLQRMGFLWGESIPETAPDPASSADYHQELYLWPATHDRLGAWLEGAHAAAPCSLRPPEQRRPSGFVDLTPAHLEGKLHLVKALGGKELPLVFGRRHPWVVGVPQELEVHPLA